MKLTIVDFTGGSDGIIALYIDNKLQTSGDDYHDKIKDWIEGFKAGLVFLKISFFVENIKIKDSSLIQEISEDGGIVPKNLIEIREYQGLTNEQILKNKDSNNLDLL